MLASQVDFAFVADLLLACGARPRMFSCAAKDVAVLLFTKDNRLASLVS